MYDYFEKVRHKDVFDLENSYKGREWNFEQKQAYKTFLGSLQVEDRNWKKTAPVFKSKDHIKNLQKNSHKFLTPGSTKQASLDMEYELDNKTRLDGTWYSFSENKVPFEKLYEIHQFQKQVYQMSDDWVFK